MTQPSITAVQTLTTPITAYTLVSTTLGAEIVSPGGRVIVPAGKINWALHGTWEGDREGFADWVNREAEKADQQA